jgi:hypothetical protein
MTQAPQLTLPAGSQLKRSFTGNGITVKLVTQPIFGPESTDWPVLEIGSAALVFLWSGHEAKLALALDENPPVTLPFTFKLAADGRSAEPIHVTLASEGSTVTVGALGQTLAFESSSAAHSSQEVIVSAGAMEDWPLASMTVSVSTPDETPTRREGPTDALPDRGVSNPTNSIPGPANIRTNPAVATGSNAADSIATTNKTGSKSGGGGLEIFTPPAIRHGHADAVRAALVSNK